MILDNRYIGVEKYIFYTYILLDPRVKGDFNYGIFKSEYKPFYIGKGKGNRALSHLKKLNKKDRKTNTIKAILNRGINPIIIKIPALTEYNAFLLEKILIENIGRLDKKLGPLLNKTDGGEGCSGNISSKKLVKQKKHNFILNHPMKNNQIKKHVSELNSKLWKSGKHPSANFLSSESNRKFHSYRMKNNNPMKNPEIAKKVGLSKKGKKLNINANKLAERNLKNKENMIINNPMKNPENIRKMLETRRKNKELKK